MGVHCSLAVIRGHPAISYLDGTNESLKYVRATDADGSNWRTPVTVDVEGVDEAHIWYCSMKEVNGHPAISYLTDTELRFAIYY